MKLAAVYNVWADSIELLEYSIRNIRPLVDGIIIVWSRKSNRGQMSDYPLPEDCLLVNCEPVKGTPHFNETRKRNHGLKTALHEGYTHFLMMDSDEFYDPVEFLREKQRAEQYDVAGMVCRTKLYFAKPTLTIGYDHTLVPFIHKLKPGLEYRTGYSRYPFAYNKDGAAQIDCTRRLNIKSGIVWSDITMHHMSWIRSDIRKKLENSSATFKPNRTDKILNDLKEARPGYHCQMYNRDLVSCDNIFNIPDF